MTRAEDVQADERVGYHKLAAHEHHDAGEAEQRGHPHLRRRERHRGRIGGTEQKAAEAQRGLHEGRHVEHRLELTIAMALHQQGVSRPQHRQQPHEDDVEAAPAGGVRQSAADKRADVGRESHGNTADAHGRAGALPRKARHGHRLHKRQRDTRGNSLQHAGQKQHPEGGSTEPHCRAGQVEAERHEHQALEREALCQKHNHRHRNAHDEHVDGSDPLPHRRIDGEVGADLGEHGVHHRLGKRPQSAGDDNDGEQGIGMPLLGKMHENLRTSDDFLAAFEISLGRRQKRHVATKRTEGHLRALPPL